MAYVRKHLDSLRRPATSFGLLIALWWLVTAAGWVKPTFLPRPSEVWAAFMHSLTTGELVPDLAASIRRLLLGLGLGSAAGFVAGMTMGLSTGVGRFLRLPLAFLNSLSGIVWLPLAIVWFGFGEPVILFIIVNTVFFIITINTIAGVQSVAKVYEQALLTLGGRRRHVITQVMIPGAFPSIITALRQASGFGWRALIAGEMIAGSSGIGWLVYKGSYDYRRDKVIAGILVIGVVAVVFDRLVFEPLERRTITRWGMV